MSDQPTQTRHPWRATARTVAAAIIGLAVLLPTISDALGVAAVPWVVTVIAVAGGITRVLAIPGVERWMRRFVPWLAAEPAATEPPQTGPRRKASPSR